MLTTTLVTTTYDVPTMLGCDALTRNIYSRFLQRGAGRSSLESSELPPAGRQASCGASLLFNIFCFLRNGWLPKISELDKNYRYLSKCFLNKKARGESWHMTKCKDGNFTFIFIIFIELKTQRHSKEQPLDRGVIAHWRCRVTKITR